MVCLSKENYFRELRLFLEEICCNLSRFRHATEDKVAPKEVKITQESYLGSANGFADIRVRVKEDHYFIEVVYGYTPDQILASLSRKYGPGARLDGGSKVVTVIDSAAYASWPELLPRIKSKLQDGLQLEVWDEHALLAMLRKYFGIEIDSISEKHVLEMRAAIDTVKGKYAFDD